MMNWTQGGTGLTNFYPHEYERYARAVELCGDEGFVIVSKPIGLTPLPADYSLHYVAPMKDLGEFWEIFNSLK